LILLKKSSFILREPESIEVTNGGGTEMVGEFPFMMRPNFEMQNFILGCRNVSRKYKESNGGFSKLRKIGIGTYGILHIKFRSPNGA
jgi:hypothetical protein